MAQIYQGPGYTLYTPAAVTTISVATSPTGTTAQGVIAIVGEADAGAPYTTEVSGAGLAKNIFGPGQLALVQAKYGSGPIVDAFRMLTTPSKDKQIVGAPSAIVIAKTNGASGLDVIKASLAILDWNGGNYGTLFDQNYGTNGNLIYCSIAANTSEVLPTTGAFTWAPPWGTVNVAFRVENGTNDSTSTASNYLSLSLAQGALPSTLAGDFGALTGVTVAAGSGADRNAISSVTGTLASSAPTGNSIVITRSVAWNTAPVVGDTLHIPTTSVLCTGVGGSTHNAGGYVVTAVGSATVTATKVSNDSGAVSASPIVAPVGAVTATTITADDATEIKFYAPITISLASGNPVDGLGKSLTVSDLATGTDLFGANAFALSPTAVTWVSTAAKPNSIASASEYSVLQKNNRQLDNRSESITAGGVVVMSIGYLGTAASITVSTVNGQVQISSAVTGGTGAALPTVLATAFPTISAFITWVNTHPGWTAAIPTGSNVAALQPLSALDQGTFYCTAAVAGETPARLKTDAQAYFQALLQQSSLVQLGNPATAALSGLPKPITGNAFLAGAGRGRSLESDVEGAIDALKLVTCNFVVPLFSRDAVVGTGALATATADVPNGVTDPNSTYIVAQINSKLMAHCLQMSQVKRIRNRQGFGSFRGTYLQAKAQATTLNVGRVALCFQDVTVAGLGTGASSYQPWMAAVCAAGMQAAGGRLLIVNKYANVTGAVQAAGDWSDQDPDRTDDALEAGLLPLQLDTGSGSWWWLSDQTTYSQDSNFYQNSIQAVYVGDTIALTMSRDMRRAFVGQSVADIDASSALSFLTSEMEKFKKLKLTAASADAPLGWKNASIQLAPPSLIMNVEAKLATGIYFVPIGVFYSQVQQSASA